MLHRSEYVADVFLLQSGDIVDCSRDGEWMGDECLCLVSGSDLFGLPVAGCAGGGNEEVVALDGGKG